MRTLLYISGILGVLLLLTGILSNLLEATSTAIYFMAGFILLVVVYLPLLFILRYREQKKLDQIIESHRKKGVAPSDNLQKGKSSVKGWSMNTSPFRKRKSGVTWGGGNIHAAGARRGER